MAKNEAELIRNDKTLEKRFWEKVNKGEENECWIWTGSKRANRYGQIRVGGKYGPMVAAHRIQLIWCGHNMEDIGTLHSCDNGLCVNPKHLSPGTQMENVQDMILKKRDKKVYGSENVNSKLTKEQIEQLKERFGKQQELKKIAKETGINYLLVWRVATRKTYIEEFSDIDIKQTKIRSKENHKSSIYTPEQVAQCRILYKELESFTLVSEKMNIPAPAVRKLVRGEQWAGAVNGVDPIPEKLGPVKQIGKRLLTEDQVREIRRLRHESNETAAEISVRFNVSAPLIYAIWHKRAYAHVE